MTRRRLFRILIILTALFAGLISPLLGTGTLEVIVKEVLNSL